MRRSIVWIAAAVLVAGAIWIGRGVRPADVERVADVPVVGASAAPPPVLRDDGLPSIVGATGWLNTASLHDADLQGRVVLVDFWTFGCINCQHTLSHVKAWYARYAPDGLVLLSVHTPEFEYEADPANVAEYVRREGILYPVALDPDRAVWRAWDNHAWPAFYLYDRDGRLRVLHLGEGSYDRTEVAIRSLLGVPPSSPRAVV